MPRPTGPTDPNLVKLIGELRRKKQNEIAKHLAKSRRSKKAVNVGQIAKMAKDNESVAVPGKVLSVGEIEKAVNVYAWQFSKAAKEKIEKAGGKCLPLRMAVEIDKIRVIS